MKITYDTSVDAPYLYLADDIAPGAVGHTHRCEIENLKGIINLDFDIEGRLLGIEVMGAKQCLPRELLRKIR